MPSFFAQPELHQLFYNTFIGNFFLYKDFYNPVLWTMTYELFGSFMIFYFLFFLGDKPWRYIVYPVVFVAFWNSYYLAFFIGLLLSDLHNSGSNHLSMIKNKYVIFLIASVGLFLGSFPLIKNQGIIYDWMVFPITNVPLYVFYHIIGAALFLLALLTSSRLQAFFSRNVFSYLGKISFSLYLIHFTILNSFSVWIFKKLSFYFSYHLSFFFTISVSMPIIFVLSHLMSRYVDEKTVLFLSKVTQKSFLNTPLENRSPKNQSHSLQQ